MYLKKDSCHAFNSRHYLAVLWQYLHWRAHDIAVTRCFYGFDFTWQHMFQYYGYSSKLTFSCTLKILRVRFVKRPWKLPLIFAWYSWLLVCFFIFIFCYCCFLFNSSLFRLFKRIIQLEDNRHTCSLWTSKSWWSAEKLHFQAGGENRDQGLVARNTYHKVMSPVV